MKKDLNILITSTGKRTLLLEYFKKELKNKGKVIAADCSILAPTLYLADNYYIVPKISHPDYINVIKEICINEKITAILSLIDPELSLLAKHRDEFTSIGVETIVSPYSVCELFLDKYETYKFCVDNSFKTAKTYNCLDEFEKAINTGEICFPVFIKPRYGSASINIFVANNFEEANIYYSSSKDMLIQEFIKGIELGVDVYIDLISNNVVSIFVKEKLAMRAGETDKSISKKSYKLFQLIIDFVNRSRLVGPVDIDVFYIEGDYYISEVNPRFGGGYPHAYECGVNFIDFLIKNLEGNVNKCEIGDYEEKVYMMKHDIVTIIKVKK